MGEIGALTFQTAFDRAGSRGAVQRVKGTIFEATIAISSPLLARCVQAAAFQGRCGAGATAQRAKARGRSMISLASIEPMMLSEVKAPFDDPGWTAELKYDGYRMLAGIEDGR
jgi:ATP-dependent DNA ligase